MANRIEAPEPKVGQVWKSNNKRDADTRFEILRLPVDLRDPHATVFVHRISGPGKGRHTHIRASRLRPTASGYTLVSEAEDGN